MRIDTLNYRKKIPKESVTFFAVLLEEQLAYFQRKDPTIKRLSEGTTIVTNLNTKLNQEIIPSTMTVQKLVVNEIFETTTNYVGGTIVQRYQLTKQGPNEFVLVYSERNELLDAKIQLSLLFVLPIYKFFYNRHIAKRINYLLKKVEYLSESKK
ncbi:hypothetical protein A5844_000028 [Enterococcus sp. 10A9_DIV0425]|uniref:DUF3284 domain-containing protein n=1 Tax=Candidatus Enterococcus wittei TaxID=1987383 RepID=A0A2C9XQX5_9ENTE|nr:DUF3284 domain-containing protein [Enterococcus sp. 10A9_DIV0425]OTP11814.1 hypothetical protein A5844_000028 [Enterococcus sp. 10A9_DIV0425]